MRKQEALIKNLWKIAVYGSIAAIIVIGFLDFRDSSRPNTAVWSPPVVTHNIVKSDRTLEELWSRSNVFTEQNDIGLSMAALKKTLFILGSLNQIEGEAILALDSTKGELLWQSSPDIRPTLFATSSALYVGSSGGGRVTAYDLRTGQVIWSERLPNTRSVRRIYAVDNILQVSSSFENFHWMDADTGEIIETFSHELGEDIFLRTNQITLIKQPTAATLRAVETQTGSLIWEADVTQAYYQGPIFTENMIFIRTRRGLGSVYAIDRQTGDILWQTKRNVVSNVAAIESVVYLLTLDGKLLGLNPRNGQLITSVKFEPSSFALNGPTSPVVGGYHVAVDEGEGLLYALLGDSRQLFAFRIVE